jgi:hypothetical protein
MLYRLGHRTGKGYKEFVVHEKQVIFFSSRFFSLFFAELYEASLDEVDWKNGRMEEWKIGI